MADTTTRYAWPYQEPGDPPDGAMLGQDLAEAVETTVGSIDDRLTDLEGKTEGKPFVRLVQQSAQSLANSTDTAITFGASSEDADTHNFHSTSSNTSRVTPTVAGWYRITGAVFVASTSSLTSLIATIAKNGTVSPPRVRLKPDSQNLTASVQVTATLSANGSTDYFELFGQQSSGGALNTNVGGSFASVLEVEYVRPL